MNYILVTGYDYRLTNNHLIFGLKKVLYIDMFRCELPINYSKTYKINEKNRACVEKEVGVDKTRSGECTETKTTRGLITVSIFLLIYYI